MQHLINGHLNCCQVKGFNIGILKKKGGVLYLDTDSTSDHRCRASYVINAAVKSGFDHYKFLHFSVASSYVRNGFT